MAEETVPFPVLPVIMTVIVVYTTNTEGKVNLQIGTKRAI